MRIFLVLFFLLASNLALAEIKGGTSFEIARTAGWTGNKEQIKTIFGKTVWNCEYRVLNTTQMILFWREFPDDCPAEVEYF